MESRCWPRPTAAALEERIDEIMDRVARAGDDHVERAAVLELALRTGDPESAADEILDDALQPFLDDLQRRAGLGTRSAAVELAAGILLGLYNCRHGNSETLLEYSPDYAAERASGVVSDCTKLGIELPAVELLDLMPEWTALLR
jgi:hypothetical protein